MQTDPDNLEPHEIKLRDKYLNIPMGSSFDNSEEWKNLFVHDQLFIESSYDVEDLLQSFHAYNVTTRKENYA